MQIPLYCHPITPDLSVQSLTASAKYAANGDLHFSFDLSGDLSAMQILSAGPSIRADHLWQHTCFEAFISALVEITAPKVNEVQRAKDITQVEAEKRLSYLANIADTEGWAIRHTAKPFNESPHYEIGRASCRERV